jgi:16S rRNA (adenine1518-N6/adenine1519-N6)-dimethyltransferase
MRQPLGQHFLKNPAPARALVAALNLEAGDTVIEVGPGHGELTEHLIAAPHARLVCVERDVVLAAQVVRRFGETPGFSVVHGDIRELLPSIVADLNGAPWKLAGNIPYYLTSFLVRILSDLPNPPVRAALLMQREVAERISAQPGSFTKLAAFTGAWANTEIVLSVPRSMFSPPPKVESAILSFIRRDDPVQDRSTYDDLVRRAFAQPRKTLVNNLHTEGITKEELIVALERVGIPAQARPHDVSVAQLVHLAALLA